MRKLIAAGILLFILTIGIACNHKESSYEQNLNHHLSKPVNLQISKLEGQDYVVYKKMEDNEAVKMVLDILSNVPWENAKVSMHGKPDYKIQTVNIDPAVSYEPVTFAFWLTPKKDRFEVIIQGQSKYGKMTTEDTKRLLSILEAP